MALRQLLLLCLILGAGADPCPSLCTCYFDQRGRHAVLCKEGGTVGSLDLFNISTKTEVLKITAPEDNMNQLTMSPMLQHYKNLEEIYITRSNVPQLGQLFFYGLKKLDVLDLSQNNITQPLDHNFRGLSQLKELYLDDNRISSLPSGTFRYLQELKVLSIQRNRITELMPSIFLEIRKLQVLKLSGNSLNSLNPIVFKDVKELKTLECRACNLFRVDKQVYELLSHLLHLDLGDNKLTTLAPEEFNTLTILKFLQLDGNQITAIEHSVFLKQTELKRLNLARNGLATVTRKVFKPLRNLTELDLSQNRLDDLQEDLLQPVAHTLEVLRLGGNHFSFHSLANLLKKLQVKELQLKGCSFVAIPVNIFPETVTVLDLSHNHIYSLQPEVIPPNLELLDLSHNRFKGLGQELMSRLDYLKVLKLDNNPFSCDLCNIIPLLDRVNRSSSFSNLQCVEPYAASGKKLGMLKRHELTWCTLPSYPSGDANFFLLGDDGRIGLIAAATSVCLLLLTALGVLGALCYSRRHAAKYYTHEDKLAMDGDAIFENHSPLFCDERELSFKFPLEGEKKLSISTIDEIRKEHVNGT